MTEEGRFHTVAQGECLSSIAEREGMLWETLWDHPANADLRRRLKDPNVLKPGDRLWIPALTPGEINCETEARHRFVKKGNSVVLRLRLLNGDRPRADQEYLLDIDGRRLCGFTDSEGNLEHRIPPVARNGELKLICTGGHTEIFQIKLGHLNPTSDLLGVQQRLRNLGFHCELTGEWDEQTRSAAASFRRKNNLPESGELDGQVRELLEQNHGS
jgi:N-acetylmuramoyl-L-alanine amidase